MKGPARAMACYMLEAQANLQAICWTHQGVRKARAEGRPVAPHLQDVDFHAHESAAEDRVRMIGRMLAGHQPAANEELA